jgi:diaminopimelate epimerase
MSAPATLIARKMHGAHNVFVLLDERGAPARDDYPQLAQRVCDPAGTFDGADGLLVVRDAPGVAAQMRIFNADGSEAEMCGNGVRCVARYLYEDGAGETFTISTLAGPIATEIVAKEPFAARVDVGPVTFPHDKIQVLELDHPHWYYEVSLGNPHAVMFVDHIDGIDLEALYRKVAAHFPNGINLHIARWMDDSTLRVRHFERGAGQTQACGTGAVACAAAGIAHMGMHSPVTARVPGGTLVVDWQPGRNALLTGPAETLFERPLES